MNGKKRLVIYLLLMIGTVSCSYQFQPLYVDLGAAATALPPAPANVYRIFIDRVGNIYPDTLLSRLAVQRAGYRLDSLFANDTILRKALQARYAMEAGQLHSGLNIQYAIAHNISNAINKAATGYQSVTVLIHGIGNDINQDNRLNRNPYDAFRLAEQRIDNQLRRYNRKTFFVEVYWDALHRIKKTDFTAVFAGAGSNAYYAGLSLRSIVNRLRCDSLVVLTHSLGARVGCELLFNQEAPHTNEALYRYVTWKYRDTTHYTTPSQKSIHLGMIVPAIPGISTFASFYQRTGHAAPTGMEKDRYSVWAGYNNKDLIISKNIIPQLYSPLIVRYAGGSTALGALGSENKKVARLFARRYPQSAFTAIDFQDGGPEQSPQTAHYFSSYCNNQHFPELIDALYSLGEAKSGPAFAETTAGKKRNRNTL